jgi:organic hydroperoxide reductase OsmC/OhrA
VRLTAGPRPELACGPPPEFCGTQDLWSAQHLMLGAVGACVVATFRALAGRQELRVHLCDGTAEGTVDKTPDGLCLTRIVVRLEVEVAEADVERARNLLMAARRRSLAANSLETPVEVESTVHGV